MGKKSKTTDQPKQAEKFYRVKNLKEKIFPVPYKTESGETKYLDLRLQKRRGQKAPLLAESAILPATKELQRKGFIKLERVED